MNILITGGTGFFGNAFVERLLKENEYHRICIYSRDEYKQSLMRAKFNNDERLRFFIGDVRDKDRLSRAMAGVDVVIHAAALKRIEVGAYNPDEMVKTNINGTMNVIDAAIHERVSSVVYLSSDKAYQPISPYGQSKALGESLIINANNMFGSRTSFIATRYGNVANSTGSVIPTWRAMGDVVNVTDPECTRFWMSANEAVDLVYGAIGKRSEKPIIPILPAFKIGDLAKAMGKEINIVGLGEFEKKHEGMCDGNTSDTARLLTVDELKVLLDQV